MCKIFHRQRKQYSLPLEESIFLLSENHISCSLAAMQLMNLKMWSPQPPIKIYIWCTMHIYADLYFVCDPNTKCGIPLYRRQVFILDINNIIIIIINIIVIIMVIKWGVGTRCVPTPKMAYFSVFKAFLFLKYFKNNLGLIESSFNP